MVLALGVALAGATVEAQSQLTKRFVRQHLPIDGLAPRVLLDLDRDGHADALDALAERVGYGGPDGRIADFVDLPGRAGLGDFSEEDVRFGVAVGDLNGDGFPDLARCGDQRVRIFRGTGPRTFGAPLLFEALGQFSSVALVDADGDLDLDVVTFRFNTDSLIELYRNDGSGVFGAPELLASLPTPRPARDHRLEPAEINGDGLLDFVTSTDEGDFFARAFAVVSNPGGSYTVTDLTTLFPSVFAWDLVVADLDGDGDQDLIEVDLNIRVSVNDSGQFQTPTTLFRGAESLRGRATVGDFDGDGNLDIAASRSDGEIVFLGRGNGAFRLPNFLFPQFDRTFVTTLSSGDIDGDGIDDILAGVGEVGRLYLGVEDRLPEAASIPFVGDFSSSRGVRVQQVGDFDGDGRRDFYGGLRGSRSGGSTSATGFAYQRETGQFELDFIGSDPTLNESVRSLGSIDFDMDGVDELSIDTGFTSLVLFDPVTRIQSRFPIGFDVGESLTADFDGDGDPDLLLRDRMTELVLVENDGSGQLAVSPGAFTGNVRIHGNLFTMDLDGDGDIDVVDAPNPGSFGAASPIVKWFNDGSGQFTGVEGVLVDGPQVFFGGWGPYRTVDSDGDGDLDLWGENLLRPIVNNGDGTFSFPTITVQGPSFARAQMLDLDGDGDGDLFAASDVIFVEPTFRTYLQGPPRVFVVDSTPVPGGLTLDVFGEVLDIDQDGDEDLLGDPPLVNRIVDLWSPTLPRLGGAWRLHAAADRALARFPTIATLLVSEARSLFAADTGFGLFQLLDPVVVPPVTIPSGVPESVIDLDVPQDSALLGRFLFAQSAFLQLRPDLTFELSLSGVVSTRLLQ